MGYNSRRFALQGQNNRLPAWLARRRVCAKEGEVVSIRNRRVGGNQEKKQNVYNDDIKVGVQGETRQGCQG